MSANDQPPAKSDELLKLASEIVAAYVSNNSVAVADLPEMIKNVHATLGGLVTERKDEVVASQKPAIPVKRSITPDYLICLEDGKRLKMLKRYLRTRFNLSPDDYRAKWNLPADYPMVAPNYAARRSDFAKQIGLGRSATPDRMRRST